MSFASHISKEEDNSGPEAVQFNSVETIEVLLCG